MIIKIKRFILTIISYIIIIFTKIDKNKIVCINFDGKGFGCNPKYIAQEAIKENFKVVWLVHDINSPVPNEINKVKYVSLKYYNQYHN